MKIALFIGSLTGGGAERVTSNLANYLSNIKNDVTVITMSDCNKTYNLNNEVNHFKLLKSNERKNVVFDNILRYKRLKQYVIEHQDIDCYIVMLPITIFMLTKLKKYTNAKLIISERNNPKSYKLYEKLIMKYAQRKCDGLVVQTQIIKDWYNINNIEVIPNAINNEILINEERKNINNKIVAVGRLNKQKNYPMMLKAFSVFSKKHPDYILEIYGQGKLEKSLKNLAKKLEISDKVFFKGYVKDVSAKIYNAKMFIMTSNFEGMPNALIEAMCLGLPCISTDCDGGGAKDLIQNMENGILIGKNDIKSLINSMEILSNNEMLANQIGLNAKKLIKVLNSNTIYKKWYEYIKKIIKEV